jgi:hypothetical protein
MAENGRSSSEESIGGSVFKTGHTTFAVTVAASHGRSHGR